MTFLAVRVRYLFGSALLVGLAGACGGTSFNGSDDDDNGGTSGSGTGGSRAGSNSGGTPGRGGTPNTAGTSTVGGNGSSGSGVGGTGGSGYSDECSALPAIGSCTAAFQRWYHDAATGVCVPFLYGGCGGNANNYETLAACQSACGGGTPNYDACQAASDCVVAAPGCCGACDGTTETGLIAYARQYEQQMRATCGGIACGACQEVPEHQQTLKYFVPDCVQGQCTVQDIRQSAVTACNDSTDCRLRSGTQCCEGCGEHVVAVANGSALQELVCGGILTPCLACEPIYPPGAIAICNANKHCEALIAVSSD